MGRVRDLGDLLNVDQQVAGVAQCFAEKKPCVRAHRRVPRINVTRINKCRLDAETRQCVIKQIVRAAVQRAAGDDVAARAHKRDDGQMQRRLAGRHRDGADAAFERGDALLQHGVGRVREPRINVARALHVEECGGVIGIFEYKRGGLVNRRRSCTGRRVGPSASMDGQCV